MKRHAFTADQLRFIEGMRQPFVVCQFIDRRVEALALSDGFCELFGYRDRPQAYSDMNQNMYKDVHPDDAARFTSALLHFATEGGRLEVIYRTRKKDGPGYMVIHVTGEHVYPEDGTHLAHIWYTEEGDYNDGAGSSLSGALNKALHEASIVKANRYDYLTGLPNMSYFFELAEAGRQSMLAQGGDPALLYIDLSGMKYYNHKYGFAEGDKLLQAFSKLLSNIFHTENCCHIGADRFAAFADENGLEALLERLFREWLEMIVNRHLPICVGIYPHRMDGVPVGMAYDRAKIACDAIKSNYASSYNYYSQALNEGFVKRQYILDNFDRALSERWIHVYYQPIMRAITMKVCNEEALARWIDPVRGFLSPADFIPYLEDAGLIHKLDLYVLDRVLENIKAQQAEGLYIVPHSINLSRSDFDACDMVEEIRRRVDAAGISRDAISIEITESVIGSDFDFIKAQVERFQALGFPVWMDDFGSGYSSLDVLQSIKFDLLKFDMNFMRKLDEILEKMQAQKKAGLQIVPHSLNLSRADFDACDIVEEIRKRVDAAGIARDRLTIEITESIIGSDFDFMKEQVQRFQALGFKVWMDDFGSGYSSLDVLQDLHFDLLKFDMRFMKRFGEGEECKVILTDLVRMAVDLGVDTVCEGVETAEEVEFLREIGCSKLQGFYFCKPIPFEEILERYRQGRQIGFENPDEAAYYASIGRVNLYDLTVLADKEDDRQGFYNTLPAGIVEVKPDGINYIRTNPAFRDFLRRYFGFDLSAKRDGYSVKPEGPPELFLKLIRQCCAEGKCTLYDGKLADGSTVHGIINLVGTNPVTGATSVSIVILSIAEPDKSMAYADIARALAADYYNIYVINLDTNDYVEYSSRIGGEELAVVRRGEDFFESAKRDTMVRIFAEDREPFLNVFTKENVVRELNAQGVFTTTYRLVDTGKPMYVNMKITRMPGGNRIIMGISIIDSQMKQKERQEELQKERDTMARMMALSDGFLSLYTVDLETEKYFEYSSTDDYSSLGVAKEGTDFFARSVSDAERVFHPEDVPAFREIFTRENVMREIRENGSFRTEYRLMFGGRPRPVILKAALFKEGEEEKLVVGVRAIVRRR